MNYFIILNKCAGGGKARLLWPKIQQQLAAAGVSYKTFVTQYDGHATSLAQQLLGQLTDNQPAVIIAAGGDGTLHEALLGCKQYYSTNPSDHQVPLAFLPIGSGNDFARALNIPLHWRAALDQILNCTQAISVNVGRYVNLGTHDNGYFSNNFGIGFDATVVHDANQSPLKNSRYFGKFSYWVSVVNALRSFQGFKAHVKIPGQQERTFANTFLLTTTNLPYFGGGIKIVPTASAYENQLDVVIVEKPNLIQLFLFVSMIFLKKHLRLRFIHHYVGQQLFVSTEADRYGQIDGEELGAQTYQLKFETDQYPFWIR
ncbi:diacylglycerol kinase [Lentilactobacillus fungorum]|uniref:Diacylglycerol kinase n=1 Tax=Lentilactobacillus fungorum TaxID=2201250 RepID=A0ABQ3W1I2_9LACO|nr:diacylglycerol kinase family protein [Lentilactobacillus fungorum]GHP15040.1 diacylglycerol kinase [Lentilactobacillus fungorum]